MSLGHHRILSLARKNVAHRLLPSLPSAPRNNELTKGQALRAKTLEPSVLIPLRRPAPLAALLIQLKQLEHPHHELHELGDCIAHLDTACNCVKVNVMGQSPANAWSVLGKRFKARHCTSFDLDSSTHPSASPLSSATTQGASSPLETSAPLLARCSSDPPRLLTPLVSASKERRVHRRASCDTAAPASSAKDDTTFAFRRPRSDPLHNTKLYDESTAPTRVSSTAAGGGRRAPPAGARPAGALRTSAARARPARPDRPDRAEAPITPSAFVAQLRQKCEKLLPPPERKPDLSLQGYLAHKKMHRIALGVSRGAKRSGVPSAPKTN